MTLRPSTTFHLLSETVTTGEESQPWFAMEASIISVLSTILRLTASGTSPSTVSADAHYHQLPPVPQFRPTSSNTLAPVGGSPHLKPDPSDSGIYLPMSTPPRLAFARAYVPLLLLASAAFGCRSPAEPGSRRVVGIIDNGGTGIAPPLPPHTPDPG